VVKVSQKEELAFGMLAWGVSLVLGLLSLLSGGSTTHEIIRVVVAGIILYYLNTPEVKQAFGRA